MDRLVFTQPAQLASTYTRSSEDKGAHWYRETNLGAVFKYLRIRLSLRVGYSSKRYVFTHPQASLARTLVRMERS